MSALPGKGDLIWHDFTPQSGREQAGRRPALVLSPRNYHEKTALVIVCPITSNMTPYPLKVMLPEGSPVSGAILVDQIRSLDRNTQYIAMIGSAPEQVVAEVQAKLAALLGIA